MGFGFGYAAGAASDEAKRQQEQARADQDLKLRQSALLAQIEGQRESNDLAAGNLGIARDRFGNEMDRQARGDASFEAFIGRADLDPAVKDMLTAYYNMGVPVQTPEQMEAPSTKQTRRLEEIRVGSEASIENSKRQAEVTREGHRSQEKIAGMYASRPGGGGGGRLPNPATVMNNAVANYRQLVQNGILDETQVSLKDYVEWYADSVGAEEPAPFPQPAAPTAPPQGETARARYLRLLQEAEAAKGRGR